MTAVTFGSLLGPVHARLEAAAGFDHAPGTEAVTAATQMAGRAAGTLTRYLADIAPYGMAEAITSPALDAWSQAVVDAREALRLAEATLRPPDDLDQGVAGSGAADPLVRWLGEAAGLLAAGRDLLRSHFGTDTQDEWTKRSDWAAVVNSVPVTRALVAAVAGWSQQLSCAMARLSVAAAGDRSIPLSAHQGLASASHLLVTASAMLWAGQRSDPASAADGELLAAVPVNVLDLRDPQWEAETDAELAAGVAASAARLRQIAWVSADWSAWSPAMTADSWQWTATAAAVVCHISEFMLQAQIHHRRSGDRAPGIRGQLRSAAEAAGQACSRWRAAASAWREIMTDTKGLTAPTVPDAGDMTVRLGRLAFGDPAWTPSLGPQAPVHNLTDRSADGVRFVVAVEAMHHAADALARIGAADLHAVRTAIRASRLYVPTRTLPEEYDVPYKFGHAAPAQAAAVVDAYQAAFEGAVHMVEDLDALAVTLHSPSRILAAVRAAAHPEQQDRQSKGTGSSAALPFGPLARELGAIEDMHLGPVEQAARQMRTTDPVLMLRAKAIDLAGRELLTEARRTHCGHSASRRANDVQSAEAASTPARLAAQSFPPQGVTPVRTAQRRVPSDDVHSRAPIIKR
jgi:hypothetical protein